MLAKPIWRADLGSRSLPIAQGMPLWGSVCGGTRLTQVRMRTSRRVDGISLTTICLRRRQFAFSVLLVRGSFVALCLRTLPSRDSALAVSDETERGATVDEELSWVELRSDAEFGCSIVVWVLVVLWCIMKSAWRGYRRVRTQLCHPSPIDARETKGFSDGQLCSS